MIITVTNIYKWCFKTSAKQTEIVTNYFLSLLITNIGLERIINCYAVKSIELNIDSILISWDRKTNINAEQSSLDAHSRNWLN